MKLRLLLLATVLVVAGCATSSEPVEVKYEEASQQTTYITDEIRLDGVDATSGLSKDNRYYLQIEATCPGQDCTPARYVLNFVKEGTQPIKLTGRDVALTVGTETIQWSDPQNRRVSQTSVIRNGTFARVRVSPEQLITIGSVSEVSGTVGGINFQIPHQNRAPIRKLLSQLDLSSASDEGGSSAGTR
jgi:hypothetical protein